MQTQQPETPLPTFRPDIEIFAGPNEEDGSPTYIIHDPVAGVFNKIGWGEAVVLQSLRHHETLPSMVKELEETTTLNASPEEVYALCEDLGRQGLTIESQIQPADKLLKSAHSKKTNVLKWLASHYLYFRLPLIHPDDFLQKALPYARLLASRTAWVIYLLVACLGLYFFTQRFETYLSTFPYFFSMSGFIAYFLVIAVLKGAHEFGHAFTAKRFGVRVPTMGLAFMVFAPVAYSDVTDAWRLRSRKKRLAIALAGVKVELVLGAFALACWGLTPPGILNSICFLLSSTTLVSTFLVNLNPCMRFDGYYILSDLWGIDNLSSQATQYAKWFLRSKLLGLTLPCPMPKPTQRKQMQIVAYAISVWFYRLFLYLGIAVIVYFKFTKTLGITLFIFEIMVFIVRPILGELKVLMKMIRYIKFNIKLALTLTAFLTLAGWAVLPLTRMETAPAIVLPVNSQNVYTPESGKIREILAEKGDKISAGDVILRLESEALNSEIDYLVVSRKLLRHEIETLTMDEERRAMIPEMERQLAAIEDELGRLTEQRKQFAIRAKISGILVALDPLLDVGMYVKKNEVIGRIASTDEVRIDAFVSEKELTHLVIGQDILFYPADHSACIEGTIEQVDPIREETVDYLEIGAVAAEKLPLIKDHKRDRLSLLESYFRVSITVPGPLTQKGRLGKSGTIHYKTEKRSLAWELLLYCYSVLVRESSF